MHLSAISQYQSHVKKFYHTFRNVINAIHLMHCKKIMRNYNYSAIVLLGYILHCHGWTKPCTGHSAQHIFSHSLYRNCGVHPGPVCFSLHDLQHSLGQDAKLPKWQNSFLHIINFGHSRPHCCSILGFATGHFSSGRVSFPSMHIIFLFCVPPQDALH